MNDKYKISVDLWIEGQKLLIDELSLKEKFLIENIKNQKETLENVKNTIIHEKEQLKDYIQNK